MLGNIMQMPLLISSLIRHADLNHGDREIVSRLVEGGTHRYTFSDLHRRSRQLARALLALGVKPGERVGTLAVNTYRHVEIYYAVSGMGSVCHTLNPRLFTEQLNYIVNHAEDSYMFFDIHYLAIIESIAPHCPTVKGWIALTDRVHMPKIMPQSKLNLLCYEELLAAQSDDYEWPLFDEYTASALCYTSGTTGNPKGVLYSHRSTLLHAYASSLPDTLCLSATDTILPVVSMFHVHAWAFPYSSALVGAKLVLIGPQMDSQTIYELFETEKVTFSAAVPTVWLGLLQYMQEKNLKLSTVKRLAIGGSAAPPAMIDTFREQYGINVLHIWGMTEMTLATVNTLKAKHQGQSEAEKNKVRVKQGRSIAGIELKVVDDAGKELPRDGKTAGDILIRGPWVTSKYYLADNDDLLKDGWLPTGDVGNIDPDGYLQLTDRSKDVIKSGGEWISSIDLENLAVAHPAVAEAAVIAVFHPKWEERPLLIAVKKPGKEVTREELLAFLQGKIAKWWMPDDVVFVDALPHTGTGKLLKIRLREEYKNYKLPTV